MTTDAHRPDQPTTAPAPFARTRDEGTARWWMGALALIKATGAETDGRFALVEIRENEGEIDFEVGGETISAGPGTMLFGPRGVPHRYTVRKGPARMLFLFTPGGFEDLLFATSDPAAELRIPVGDEGMPDFGTLPRAMAANCWVGGDKAPSARVQANCTMHRAAMVASPTRTQRATSGSAVTAC